jgi:ABC-type cobalt transport system substrate-binding protein
MRMIFTLVIVVLLTFSIFTSAYAGSDEKRTMMAKELTGKYQSEGFPVTFEATGKDKIIIRIT